MCGPTVSHGGISATANRSTMVSRCQRAHQMAGQRRRQELQKIRKQNADLKKAIQALVQETTTQDRSELRGKIYHIARIAELEVAEPSPSAVEEGEGRDLDAETMLATQMVTVFPHQHYNHHSQHKHNQHPKISTSSQVTMSPINIQSSYSVGTASPPRDDDDDDRQQQQQSLIPDPFQYLAINPPPKDMLPFMGPQGAYTLAGRITWAVVEKALGVYRELSLFEEGEGASTSPGPTAASSSKTVLIKPRVNFRRLPFPLTAGASDNRNTYLMALWEALDGNKRSGRGEADGDGGGGESSSRNRNSKNGGIVASTHWLLKLMERERGGGETHYSSSSAEEKNRLGLLLNPTTAEKRLRTIVGEDVFGVVAKAARENEIGRVSNHDDSNLIDGLLDHLADTFVCFGEGPRWDVRTFDHVLRVWLSSVSSEAAAVCRS